MMCITLLQVVQDLLQGTGAQTYELAGGKALAEVRFRKTEIFKVEVRAAVLPLADRICFGYQVSFFPISKDQDLHTEFAGQLCRIG